MGEAATLIAGVLLGGGAVLALLAMREALRIGGDRLDALEAGHGAMRESLREQAAKLGEQDARLGKLETRGQWHDRDLEALASRVGLKRYGT